LTGEGAVSAGAQRSVGGKEKTWSRCPSTVGKLLDFVSLSVQCCFCFISVAALVSAESYVQLMLAVFAWNLQ